MAAAIACWVRERGDWRPAEAVEFADTEVRIHFIGFPWRPDCWLPLPRLPTLEGVDQPECSLSDEPGDEEARVSFDQPPRGRAASRHPRPPSLVQAPSSSSSASGTTPPPFVPSAARRPRAPTAWCADVGIGAEVLILTRGAHEGQRGIVERARHGYLVVRSAAGARVHARARDLAPAQGASLCRGGDGDGAERVGDAEAGSISDPPHCEGSGGAELGRCEEQSEGFALSGPPPHSDSGSAPLIRQAETCREREKRREHERCEERCEDGLGQTSAEGELAWSPQPAGELGPWLAPLLPSAGAMGPGGIAGAAEGAHLGSPHRSSSCEDTAAPHYANSCEEPAAPHPPHSCDDLEVPQHAASCEDTATSHTPAAPHCENQRAPEHPESSTHQASCSRGKGSRPPADVHGAAVPPRSCSSAPLPTVSAPLPLTVGCEVVVTRPGFPRARGAVSGRLNGFWTVGLYRGGAPLNVRAKDLVVVARARAQGGKAAAGGVRCASGGSSAGGGSGRSGSGSSGGGDVVDRRRMPGGGGGSAIVGCSRDGRRGASWSRPRRKGKGRTLAERIGVAVGTEVEILHGREMTGRRGFVVKLCNGYATVHVAEGVEGEVVEMHLRSWQLRLHRGDYIGCWCDTQRHLPTTETPFEGVWVQCDECSRWCHGECAGLDRTAAEQADSYTCLPCTQGGAPPSAVSPLGPTGISPHASPRARKADVGAVGGSAAGENKTSAAGKSKIHSVGEQDASAPRKKDGASAARKQNTFAAGESRVSAAGKDASFGLPLVAPLCTSSPQGEGGRAMGTETPEVPAQVKPGAELVRSAGRVSGLRGGGGKARSGRGGDAAECGAGSDARCHSWLGGACGPEIASGLRPERASEMRAACRKSGGAGDAAPVAPDQRQRRSPPAVSEDTPAAPPPGPVSPPAPSPHVDNNPPPHRRGYSEPTPSFARGRTPRTAAAALKIASAAGGRRGAARGRNMHPSGDASMDVSPCVDASTDASTDVSTGADASMDASPCLDASTDVSGGVDASMDVSEGAAPKCPPLQPSPSLTFDPPPWPRDVECGACGGRETNCTASDTRSVCCACCDGWVHRVCAGLDAPRPGTAAARGGGGACNGPAGLPELMNSLFVCPRCDTASLSLRSGTSPPGVASPLPPGTFQLLHAAKRLAPAACSLSEPAEWNFESRCPSDTEGGRPRTPRPYDDGGESLATGVVGARGALLDAAMQLCASSCHVCGARAVLAGEGGEQAAALAGAGRVGMRLAVSKPDREGSGEAERRHGTAQADDGRLREGGHDVAATALAATSTAPTAASPVASIPVAPAADQTTAQPPPELYAVECSSCGGHVHTQCLAGGLSCAGGETNGGGECPPVCQECETFVSHVRRKGSGSAEQMIVAAAARAARGARRRALATGAAGEAATPAVAPEASLHAGLSGGDGGGGNCGTNERMSASVRRSHTAAHAAANAPAAQATAQAASAHTLAHACFHASVRASAYAAAAHTSCRLRLALRHQRAVAGASANSSLCRWVLERGNGELFYSVLLFLDDAWALRAASCVCAGWRRLLDRAADGAACVWSSATLTAPRGRGWASLRATRPGDKVRLIPGSFSSALELSHPLEMTGAPCHATMLSGHLVLRGTPGRVGVLRDLHLSHFYNPAVTLLSGAWRFEGCNIDSSRRTARACAGVVLRGGATLELVGCTISSASAAVNLCEAGCALTAYATTFRNVKSGVLCERGGVITLAGCRFDALSGSDVGLRLSADTVGDVRASSVARAGTLWGRMAPPPGVVFVEAAAAADDVDVAAVEAEMGGMLLQAAGAAPSA